MSRRVRVGWIFIASFVGIGMGLLVGVIWRTSGTESVQEGTDPKLSLSPSPVIGSPAPDFLLQGVDGKEYSLSDMRGKIVLLNFWATWCSPCLVEMPTLQSINLDYEESDLSILAINNDEAEAQVRTFGQELGLTFPLLLDPGGETQKLFHVRAYPTSIFVDTQGVIRNIHFGILEETQIEQYLVQIRVRD
jgi:peroxiredoxin